MKKSIGLLMIVMAVISMAFVSCDANTAPQADILGEIYLSNDSQSRGITAIGTNTHEVESLYWYYKAEKKDTGLFNTGVTNGFVPVKTNAEGASKGLNEANLGQFSYGKWTFTFYGVKEAIAGVTKDAPAESIGSGSIVYSGSQTIEVNKDRNFLNLTLNEGAGLTTEIKFDTTEGVWFSHKNIKTGTEFSLAVVDKVNGVPQGTITSGTATVEAEKVSFKNMSYTAPEGGIAEGQHVMTFTLTQTGITGTDTNIAKVATYELVYTVSKGLTYTVKGDLTSAEVKGEVSVGSYAASVPVTTASLVIPVESSESKTVKTETTVSTLDLTVKYPVGAKLADTTNTSGSGSNVTADATIGFKLDPSSTDGIAISGIGESQELTKYTLTLNVAGSNEELIDVSKFIGKDLEVEAVYHKGKKLPYNGESYEYNPETGFLTLKVYNASPIDVVTKKVLAVASIGDEKFTTLSAAIEAAADGDTITILSGANVTLDNGIANGVDKSRNITFKGNDTQTVDVITNTVNAEGGQLNYQRGSSFTFENLTIQAGEGSFDGIVCDELTFKNCTITGKLTLFGKATFTNCTFENNMANQYSIWTWGGTNVTFEGCTFNTNGKAILLYGGASGANPTNLVVNNCEFNDRTSGATGKAAIEIGNDYNATYTLTVNNATVHGFAAGKYTGSKLWANKNRMDSEHLTVTIDGKNVPIYEVTLVSTLDELETAVGNLHDGDYIAFGANIVQDKVDTTSGQVSYSLADDATGNVEVTIDLNGFVFDGQWGGFFGVPNLTVNILGVEKSVAEYYKHETGNHMVKACAVFNGEKLYSNPIEGYQTTVLKAGLFESNNLTVMAYGGKVIIDGAEIANTADGGAIYTCNSPIVEILSGKLSCEQDGSLFVLEPYRENEGPSIVIKGGEFDASKAACMLFVDGENASKRGSVVIEGGNFKMVTSSTDNVFIQSDNDVINKDRLQIKGGTFNIDPSDYVVSGFHATNSNGVWTVVPSTSSN